VLSSRVSGWASYLQAVFIAPVEIIASPTYLFSVHWVNQHLDMVRPSGLLTGRELIVAILAMVGFTALNLGRCAVDGRKQYRNRHLEDPRACPDDRWPARRMTQKRIFHGQS
jgi:hypothetical protein